jgi:xanthine dehydrogenase accessory factor
MDQYADEGWAVLEQAAELKRQGQAFALATVVWRQGPSSGKQGSRAIITLSGEIHGWIGGACAEPVVIRQAGEVIAEGLPRLLLLGTSEQFGAAIPDGIAVIPISCQSEGALEVYIEPVLPTPHLVVVGKSPMAQTLVELAQALGWRTDLLAGPDFSRTAVNERSMVVVASQGHSDEEAVEEAVAAAPAYVGLVASRRRGESVLGYLAQRGVPAEQLDRVRVPAGLDLGRTSHREVAVAILAELVQLRASGAMTSRAAATTAIAGARTGRDTRAGVAVAEAAEAVDATDPVCGMSVTPGATAHPSEHGGATYYFCCTGCRRKFEADPAAYVKEGSPC